MADFEELLARASNTAQVRLHPAATLGARNGAASCNADLERRDTHHPGAPETPTTPACFLQDLAYLLNERDQERRRGGTAAEVRHAAVQSG
jgi:hypothetical protein